MTLLAEVAHLASGHDYPYRDVFIRVTDELVRLQTELTETRDLAEHWAILAEQRRVELGECRKEARSMRQALIGWRQRAWPGIDQTVVVDRDYPITAAMEAKP